jgi:hypothetical protein
MVLPASIGSLAGKVLGKLGSFAATPVKEAAKVGLDAVSGWIVAGAEAMLQEVVKVISAVTTPSLSVSWFSTNYWQMAALAMLLTLPFLFAAAVQAVIQTNVAILVRAAFVDLPLAAISVTLAAPLITLMLAATDQMCSLVGGGGTVGGRFLTQTASQLSGAGSGFMLVVIAVVILLAGMVLLVELIMRSAAIYIVVLFLPIGFAAMVWPARRVWVKRLLETLIALILSKFAMVAILSMSVAALASLTASPSALTTAFTAMALTVLAACSPWALLRLLPFTELAVSAASTLRQEIPTGGGHGLKHAVAAANLGAGLVVDPVMEGVGGLRNFVSGNAPDDASASEAGTGRLARLNGGGGGTELPPGPGPVPNGGSGVGGGPGGPGFGPESSGGADPQPVLPVDPGEVLPPLEALNAVSATTAALGGAPGATVRPEASSQAQSAGGLEPVSAPWAVDAPGTVSGPGTGPPEPLGGPNPGVAAGELRPGLPALASGPNLSGDVSPLAPRSEATAGPIDDLDLLLQDPNLQVGLGPSEAGWIRSAEVHPSADGEPAEGGDA